MRLAYLVNIYPRVSHTFIKREILALEAAGATVERYTIRACDTPLVDETDRRELKLTRVIQSAGAIGFFFALLTTILARPRKFFAAYASAMTMRKTSDKGFITHVAYLAEACILRKWLGDPKTIHLHAHHGTSSAAVASLCRELGGPSFSFTVHGPEEFERANQLDLARKVANANFVVAISEFGRGQLCRWSEPGDWAKLNVVRCGVDDRFLRNTVLPPISERPRLVCVGRLCVEKGQLVLLEAARLLMERGIAFELVLAGDGPLRDRLQKRIASAGLSKHVSITGWVTSEQVKEQILNARAMVLPSFAEGLPVVIMEALALGRPVISTPVAGIPELVESGRNGWLVQPGSPEQLAAAMTEALQMPIERLGQMGAAGALAVAQRHDATIEANKLQVLFNTRSNGHAHGNGHGNGHAIPLEKRNGHAPAHAAPTLN